MQAVSWEDHCGSTCLYNHHTNTITHEEVTKCALGPLLRPRSAGRAAWPASTGLSQPAGQPPAVPHLSPQCPLLMLLEELMKRRVIQLLCVLQHLIPFGAPWAEACFCSVTIPMSICAPSTITCTDSSGTYTSNTYSFQHPTVLP